MSQIYSKIHQNMCLYTAQWIVVKKTVFRIKSQQEKYKQGACQTQTSEKLEVGSDDSGFFSSFVLKLNCSQLFCVWI